MERSLALFDFDGTISIKDSTQSFYRYLYKSIYFYFVYHYLFCVKENFLTRLGLTSYINLKNKRLHVHTSRFNEREFFNLTEGFNKNCFDLLLNPKAIERINWHKDKGHEVWIISASYDFLLDKWCLENGINLITNKTIWALSKRQALGNDVNYGVKVDYLNTLVDLSIYKNIYAYGDSEGDNAMLSIANYKFFKPFRN